MFSRKFPEPSVLGHLKEVKMVSSEPPTIFSNIFIHHSDDSVVKDITRNQIQSIYFFLYICIILYRHIFALLQ